MKTKIKSFINGVLHLVGSSFVVLVVFGCSLPLLHSETKQTPYVLLISIDGYRYDYTDLYNPPALKKFRDTGSYAKSLIPVYPSKTFPNHISIITGMYAEDHGIVNNEFYDMNTTREYDIHNQSEVKNPEWYFGTPIWTVAEKQNLISATYFWPGSEAPIQNILPTYFIQYEKSTPNEASVDQIISWLKLPEDKRPHFLTLYFSAVDSAGHKFGVNSPELANAIKSVDETLSNLFSKLEQLNLNLNTIIVSDHGMQNLDSEKMIYLDDYISTDELKITGFGPQASVYCSKQESCESTYASLKTHEKNFKVYRRSEIPKEYHYSKTSRVGDLLVDANAPYSISIHGFEKELPKASHGYAPLKNKMMHGIFYANGPAVVNGQIIDSFENIHIYPFILKILGLHQPSEIDGKIEVLQPILR